MRFLDVSSTGLRVSLIILSLIVGGMAANAQPIVGADAIRIISISPHEQWIEIANQGTGRIDLEGWMLIDQENRTYTFPANVTLKAGSSITVHSRDGINTPSDLFNSSLLWGEIGAATLTDATGRMISRYIYPVEVTSPRSLAATRPLTLPDAFSSGGLNPPFQPMYRSPSAGGWRGSSSRPTANMTGHPFICHGGPLNWAWTSGLG